jgi:hypothetical protein
MEQGDIDALCYYIECLVQDGRAVSSELRGKLASVAGLSERAADALRTVDHAGRDGKIAMPAAGHEQTLESRPPGVRFSLAPDVSLRRSEQPVWANSGH